MTGAVQDVTFLNILPLESLTFTPELVASSCGYFKEHNLNVKFETTQGSAQAIQTVIAGSALITRVGDMETMVATGEKHAPLLNVGQINKTGTIRFVSDKSNPIKTAADLKDRLMGTPSEGGTSDSSIKVAASSAGIDPDEVKTQVVGLAPGVFDLVKSGRIGGYVVSPRHRGALAEAAARRGRLRTLGRRPERRPGLHHLARTRPTTRQAEAAAQVPRRHHGGRSFVAEGRGQRLRRDDQVPAEVTTSPPSRTRRSPRPRSTSTSSRGPRPAADQTPRTVADGLQGEGRSGYVPEMPSKWTARPVPANK